MTDIIGTIRNVFPDKTLVIAGDLVADQFLHGSISRVSREAPVFILRHEETETRPGAAANAAANVASLGGRAVVVGLVGNDENGRLLGECLTSAGVNWDHAVRSDVTTTTKVRVLAGQHFSTKQQVIRIDYEGSREIDEGLRSKLIDSVRALADSADAFVISDYGYGVANAQLFAEARSISERRKIPLLIDSRFRLREFPMATSATPNQEEVEQLLGRGFTDADCSRLCSELEFRSLLVTRGSKGMVLIEPGKESFRVPAVGPTEPIDVTGAGDTVIAAYALGLASGLGFRESAVLANHAGGIVVMKKGTATVSRDELITSIANEDGFARTDSAA
jgi:rfaE bifunctional protein kinase chain/domain